MEITKVVKPFIRRGANTFGNIVYIYIYICVCVCVCVYLIIICFNVFIWTIEKDGFKILHADIYI